MANKYTNPLMDKLNEALKRNNKGGGYKNVLSTKPENTYLVRIIPNVEEMEKTFFQYYLHGWTSATDGRYVSAICPSTYGEECPICNERFRLWNKGDEASKELSRNLARKERFYSNVYVVDDPTNEENNGTVKILGYGRQIKKIIDEAREGDDAEEIGGRMIDFTKEGCNLRIKVEKNSAGFPNYDRSKFVSPSAIAVSYDDIADLVHDFDPLLSRKTTEEMKDMLENALYGAGEATKEEPVEEAQDAISALQDDSSDDDIPMDFDTPEVADEADILDELDNL